MTEETTVEIRRDRSASDAGDDDFTVEPITIEAGSRIGHTNLKVTEDNEPEGVGKNRGETLLLYAAIDRLEIGVLEFTIWDAAAPALPVIAQLLLAALMAAGGRRYLQRIR